MSLEGSIKDFGLSDIFQLIYVQQKSGLMAIQHQDRKATVGFVKGMVVSAQLDTTEEGMERIGDVLVRAKRITRHQLDTALKIHEDRNMFLGQVLVSERFLSPEDLKRALKLQTLEAVYRLFRWKDGRYTFDQQQVPYPKEYVEPISTEHILMEGIRRLDEWPYIEKKIPSRELVFAQVPDKQAEFDQVDSSTPKPVAQAADDPLGDLEMEAEGTFTPDEITVYRAVNGTDSVSRLIELVQLGEFEVCKALANLLTAGLIVPVTMPGSRDGPEERRAGSEKLRAGLSAAFQWTVNVSLIGALVAAAAWVGVQARNPIISRVESNVRSLRVVILPHHLQSLRDLVHVWEAERGGPPASIVEAISVYGASKWPLRDPWGKPWRYDSATDTISASLDINEVP